MHHQFLPLALLFLVATTPVCAQTQQPAKTDTLETTVEQVIVDVVVTDKGKHIHDLDRARFHIFEDGKEQKVVFFDEHKPPAEASSPIAPPQLPPHVVGNAPASSGAETINVLLFDSLNTPAASQQDLRRQMLESLDKLPPGKTIAIFMLTSKLSQLQGFTSDRATLEAAIRSVKNGAKPTAELDASDPYEALQFDYLFTFGKLLSAADSAGYALNRRVEITLDAFNNLAKYLSLLPGRKNLIWFSGSFPLVTFPDDGYNGILRSARNFTTQIDETAARLASARVAIYPVQVRGLQTDEAFSVTKNSTDDSSLYGVPDMGAFTQDQTMQNLAHETGGVAYLRSNDLMTSLQSALNEGDSYYTLGFTPSVKNKSNDYRKLKVVVDDSGNLNLDYRRGYFKNQAAATNDALNAATLLGAPQSTDLQFIARALPSTDPAFQGAPAQSPTPAGDLASSLKPPLTRYLVDLKVDPHKITFSEPQPGTHTANLEFIVVAYDADGKRVNFLDRGINLNADAQKFSNIQTNGILTRLPIDLPAGKLTLRMVVYDKSSNQLGAIELPINVVAN